MQERHSNREIYINEQVVTTQKHVIPFLQEFIKIDSSLSVLEIGCGEGGNLKPFLDLGCSVTWVDFSVGKIEKKRDCFINPNYEIKFGLKPRAGIPIVSSIPYFKNFVITSTYYLVSNNI